MAIDEIQIQQVLVNLIRNAMDAMRTTDSAERQLMVTSQDTRDGMIRISICDQGEGVADQNADRVFDAFYTTKEEGMGMGLAISRTIVETHGGKLWMERNEDRGVTFLITLPIAG